MFKILRDAIESLKTRTLSKSEDKYQKNWGTVGLMSYRTMSVAGVPKLLFSKGRPEAEKGYHILIFPARGELANK